MASNKRYAYQALKTISVEGHTYKPGDLISLTHDLSKSLTDYITPISVAGTTKTTIRFPYERQSAIRYLETFNDSNTVMCAKDVFNFLESAPYIKSKDFVGIDTKGPSKGVVLQFMTTQYMFDKLVREAFEEIGKKHQCHLTCFLPTQDFLDTQGLMNYQTAIFPKPGT